MTTPAPAPTIYTPGSYYAGVLHGWIHYLRDEDTGTLWWLDVNQWRYWDGYTWRFAGVRTNNNHTNTVGGFIIGLLFIGFGLFFHLPSSAMIVLVVLGVFIFLVGCFDSHTRNHHPNAYQALSVAAAAGGAHAVYKMTHKAHRDFL